MSTDEKINRKIFDTSIDVSLDFLEQIQSLTAERDELQKGLDEAVGYWTQKIKIANQFEVDNARLREALEEVQSINFRTNGRVSIGTICVQALATPQEK